MVQAMERAVGVHLDAKSGGTFEADGRGCGLLGVHGLGPSSRAARSLGGNSCRRQQPLILHVSGNGLFSLERKAGTAECFYRVTLTGLRTAAWRTLHGVTAHFFSSPVWTCPTMAGRSDPVGDPPPENLASTLPPRGENRGSGVAWPVVLREHAANDIFVDLDAEGMRDLLGDAHTAEPGIAALQLDDRRDEFRGRTFGTGFAATATREEKSRRYFRSTKALWNLNSVAGLMSAPSFGIRRGLTNSVVSPSTKRSSVVRFGARCRERLLIRS